MTYNSLAFLVFFALVLILYYGLPGRFRTVLVLLSSAVFYGIGSLKVLPFLAAFSLAVWLFGRLTAVRHHRIVFVFAVVSALLPLCLLKYTGLSRSFVVPLGISYFTFKAVSYLVDIRRGDCEAERDPLIVMTYLMFFPEIMIGPIDRAASLMGQLKAERPPLRADNIGAGALLFLFGCLEKMAAADRLGLAVDLILGDLDTYHGLSVAAAALMYSLQIYFDFAGCSAMAIGIGRMMGFRLAENFRQPYLAVSVVDFWRRWHISLTSWLRDYVYIPLGGSRRGPWRRRLNVLLVFLVSGIWHGAGIHYIVWGLLNGLFQVAEGAVGGGSRGRSRKRGPLAVWLGRGRVFILMSAAWIFFRAPSFREALRILGSLVRAGGAFRDEAGLLWGLSNPSWILRLILILLITVVDLLREYRGISADSLMRLPFAVRCFIFYGLIFGVIVFGLYGTAYDAAGFIYLQY